MTSTSIVWTLKERERTMHEELVLTIALRDKLQSKSTALRDKKVKRPSVSADNVEDELKRLTYQLNTGSLSKKEEKEMLKEMQSVKAARRENEVMDSHWNNVNAAKLTVDDAFAKVNRLRDALTEIRSAVRQFELCAKIEALHNNGTAVSPGDLESKILDVPDPTVLGQIIGRGGVGVDRLRSKHCVEFDTIEDGETTQIKLTGLAAGLATAAAAIQGVLNSISKELEVRSEVIKALLHNRAARLHTFGDKHDCSVEPNRPIDTTLTIRGLEESIDACSADILTFQNSALEVSVPEDLIAQVVGSKANVLTSLQEEHGVYINIDREQLVFRIFHEELSPKQACAEVLTQAVEDLTQHDDELLIDPKMAPSLIGKGGEKIQQLQKENRCLVTVDRENRGRVILRGTRKSLEMVKAQIQELSEIYAKEHQKMDCSAGLSGILISRSGEVVKQLEKEHEVRITVDRSDGTIQISGKQPQVEAAQKAIQEIQSSLLEETINDLTSDEISMVIGRGGATIKGLTKDHKCDINIERDSNQIVISGMKDNVNACKIVVEEMINKFRRENIEMKVDPTFLPAFIGKGGEEIKKFRKGHEGVEINLGDRGSGIVKLRGEEEKLQAVKKAIEDANVLYLATHVEISIMQKQVNLLIGHRGETIKKLQKETGCFIDIRKGDNKARVRGETAEAVQTALAMIVDIIGTEWESRKIKLPVASAAAYVVGKKGETIQKLQKTHGVVIEINRQDDHVDIFGPSESCDAVMKEIETIFLENVTYYKRIEISQKYVSAIIGRGGENIRQLQTESQADLSVQRPGSGKNDRNNGGDGKRDNYRRNRDDNPLDPEDVNNQMDDTKHYIIIRGKVDAVRKGIELLTNAIAELRQDQMVLKPQHMASLKQQQSTQFVAMELRFNVDIVLDMERNTVTFNQKSQKDPQILLARMQIHNLLHFFYPKEFAKVDMPSDINRQLDRELPKLRIESGAKMSLIPTATAYCVLVSGDELQTTSGVAALEEVKTNYLKTARDVNMPSDMIPGIIGKGGSGIRALEEQFKLKISTDKRVNGLLHLRGEPDAIDIAEEFFLTMRKDYEATFCSYSFDPDATSTVIGRGGVTIRKLQDDHNVRIDIDSNTPGIAKIRSDDPDDLAAAVAALEEVLAEAGYGDDIITDDMKVFRQHVGAIVGEGGSVIRQLEADSKAQIKIRKTDDEGTVSLRGTPEAVAKAKELIAAICAAQEEEYAKKRAEMKKEQDAERAARAEQNGSSSTNNGSTGLEEQETKTMVPEAPRFIPGMSADQQNVGHSMSAQAQKNRRKRERRKAAGKDGSKAASKVEHYQQDLEQLLGFGLGGSSAATTTNATPSASSWNPPPPATANVTPRQAPPPGFGLRKNSVNKPPQNWSGAHPPGFSPVPKNRRKPMNDEVNATMSKLADLGFSSSSLGGEPSYMQPTGNGTSNGAASTTSKKYVSARGGYKLRL